MRLFLCFPFSHSIQEDSNKGKCTLALQDGDILSVELNSSTNSIIYTKEAVQPFVQITSIGSTTVEPVHLCVFLSTGSDVSIM